MKKELEKAVSARVVAKIVRTRDRDYAYDVCSNRIIQLDDAEARILRLKCAGMSEGEGRKRIEDLDSCTPVCHHIAKFDEEAKALGVFQPIGQRTVDTKVDKDGFRMYMENHLRSVSLEVTELCNLRCSYCVYDNKQVVRRRAHSNGRMPVEFGRKAVDHLLRHSAHHDGTLAICFYGGEPLLEIARMEKILEYASSRFHEEGRQYDCHITTNGTLLLDSEVREFLVRNDVSLLVSLDGPEHLHNRCRKHVDGRGSYREVISGLRQLLHEEPAYYGERVSFNAVYTTTGAPLEIVDHLTGLDIYQESRGELRITAATGVPLEDYNASLRSRNRSWEDVFVENRREDASPEDGMGSLQRIMHARLAQRVISPLPAKIRPEGFCVPGGRKLFVSVDGRFTICERMRQYVDIGSVDEGIDADLAADLTESLCEMWQSKCSFCFAQRFCGVCLAQVAGAGGHPVPDDFDRVCRSNRRAFESALRTFIRICDQNPNYLEEMQKVVLS